MLDAAPDTGLASLSPPDHRGCIRHRVAVLATYSQAETWAESNLRQRGYDPFVPRYTARQRDRAVPSVWHSVLRPLFPGYIFVPYSPPDPWRPIRYCPGIRANLLGGNGIQYVNAGVVEALQATEDARRHVGHPNGQWAPGTPCSARYGALAGFPAAVVSVRGEQALIAVMLLGALREIRVPLDTLVARE